MVEIPTYQIGMFVFDLTFSIEKIFAKTRPYIVFPVFVETSSRSNFLFIFFVGTRTNVARLVMRTPCQNFIAQLVDLLGRFAWRLLPATHARPSSYTESARNTL